MRKPRPIPAPEIADGWHHLYTRTVNREIFFSWEELALLMDLIRRLAEYCHVIVCTHMEMGNHPHFEVYVRKREHVSDEEIYRLYCLLHPKPSLYARQRIVSMKRSLQQTGRLSDRERERHLAQMFSKSRFMQLLKPRFTKLFNKAHNRSGPLWDGRFLSQVFSGEIPDRRRLAAYIDDNACRAGICEDPKDYPFCGYAQALAGDLQAQAGLVLAWGGENWEQTKPEYRIYLHERGSIYRPGKAQIPQAAVEKVLAQGGELTDEQIREGRHAYFTRGGAIGDAPFVQAQIDLYRKQTGKGQRMRPFPIPPGYGLDGLYVMSRPRLRHF